MILRYMNRVGILWFILVLILSGCGSQYHVVSADYENYSVSVESNDRNEDVEKILNPYRVQMEQQMNETLVMSNKDMFLGKPESRLGNFAADATEHMAGVYSGREIDFAIQNYSGLRIKTIGRGPIRLGQMYELMPFDNYLVIVELSAEEVRQLCDFMAGQGGWPSSKSLTYEIENEKAIMIKIKGEPLGENGYYTVATNDYIVRSADYQGYLKEKDMENTNVFVRDAFAEYLRALGKDGKKFDPVLDGRVKNKEK